MDSEEDVDVGGICNDMSGGKIGMTNGQAPSLVLPLSSASLFDPTRVLFTDCTRHEPHIDFDLVKPAMIKGAQRILVSVATYGYRVVSSQRQKDRQECLLHGCSGYSSFFRYASYS